ncbi:MAG: cyclic nucleotide-binding domain-containing protein [Treponema sp.]|jgi:Na+/H+ antiporter NhaC/CRP-like cAMP-binding protein|nr:cyclic nucleotide-binding domain-containing protein [Treponema sp.]
MEAKVVTRDYIKNFFRLEDSAKDRRILDYIMERLVLREYHHNSYICRIGDAAKAMYFIEAGVVNVLGGKDEIINQLYPGRYFGEIAALTDEKRSSAIRANGTVLVYELDKHILNTLTTTHKKIYGIFLQNVYDQASEKYRSLIRTLNLRRGQGISGARKKSTPVSLFINYYLVFFIFLNLFLFCPTPAQGRLPPVLLCSPLIFLVGYIIITKRALESLVLSMMYLAIMMAKLNFIVTFTGQIAATIIETTDLLLIVLLMGVLTRLFSASGSINALKYVAEQAIKTAKGTMLAAFCSMFLIAIDEYLCILVNGACFRALADDKRIPREKSSIVMGMMPGALCILNPISLTGIYLTGLIVINSGRRGLFIQAARFNFSAILTLIIILLLALERLPLAGDLRKAVRRVKEGGALWPPGTDDGGDDDTKNRGRVINLALPVFVLIGSSVALGSLEAGVFSVNVLSGLIITLVVTFFLYCFQQYMTPDQYFNHVIHGIESMLVPVVMFIMGKCFASGMDEIGFSAWLNEAVKGLIAGQEWLLPALIFGVFTLVGALFDNPWAMYAIGIPIAGELALSVNGNAGLFTGAVCAAGLIGNEIALGDIFFIGPMLGVNPMAYYRAKLPYVILITALSFGLYGGIGYYEAFSISSGAAEKLLLFLGSLVDMLGGWGRYILDTFFLY